MTDRFKFRQPVYDKGNFERFHYWGRNTEDGTTFSTPESNNGFKDYKPDEQCTGRVDRNNKLIYENDIIQDAMGDVCLVSYDADDCCFILQKEHDCFIFDSDVYIIGNIHENKELLK